MPSGRKSRKNGIKRLSITATVHYPRHYKKHPSGVECITIAEHLNFNLGNALKYIWRCGLKSDDKIVDLEKAVWYLNREIKRIKTYERKINRTE